MKQVIKKFSLFLLCFCILFGSVGINAPTEIAEARTIFEIEEELKQYKNMLASLQSELSSIAGNISSIEGKTGQTMALMEQYIAEIDALDAEIEINTAIMESYDLKRSEVVTEMAIIQEDYDYRISMYKKLMQFIYENGDTNSFELLFSSGNISEFLTRRDNFNDIMNAANNLIKEIEVSIADLETLDAELAEAQSKYDEYLTELNTKKLGKETKVKEFETIAGELNLNADELRDQYSGKNSKVAEIKAKISELEEERKELFNSSAEFIWPVANYVYVSSRYGWRSDPFGGSSSEFHNGIDIATGRGTPIYASKAGVVTRADWWSGYGNCVIIYHGGGVSTLYAHCDNGNGSRPTFEVSVGDTVNTGDVIAYVGTTGRSTGYHLHFSVMTNSSSTTGSGNYVDPALYLPKGYFN